MAQSITIKIGTIVGESNGVGPDVALGKAKPHAGEIDVLSWHWGHLPDRFGPVGIRGRYGQR